MTDPTFAQIQANLEAFGRRLDRLEARLRLLRPDPDPRGRCRPDLGALDFTELQEATR